MASDGPSEPVGRGARPPAGDADRSPDEIEADIERARIRLAYTVDEIVDRVKPKNVFRRMLASVKAKFVDETGSPRPERVVVAAVAAAAVIALVAWRKSR